MMLSLRRVGLLLAAGGLLPGAAWAEWGENWGTMFWSAEPTAVPTLELLGLGLLSLALAAGAAWSLRQRAWTMSVLLLALAIPLAAAASPITGLHIFQNNTPADATEVNENFADVETAVNDNDSRITAVETDTAAAQASADAAQATADAAQVGISGSCAAGSSIRTIAGDGSVTCEADTDTNTTYSAGVGLILTGTTLSANPSVLQGRIGSECPAGSSIRKVTVLGNVTCEPDTDTQLSAAEVDALVADNGYGLATDVATNAADIAALAATSGGMIGYFYAQGGATDQLISGGTYLPLEGMAVDVTAKKATTKIRVQFRGSFSLASGSAPGDQLRLAIFVDGHEVGAYWDPAHTGIYSDTASDEVHVQQAVIDFTFSRGSGATNFPADTSSHNVEIRWRVGGGTSQYEAVRTFRTLTVTEIDL